jgi:hypothetical protein
MSSVTRQRKSSHCRQFEPVKNGTAMAHGLPLTSVGGRCGDTGDATSDPLEAVSQAKCRWERLGRASAA